MAAKISGCVVNIGNNCPKSDGWCAFKADTAENGYINIIGRIILTHAKNMNFVAEYDKISYYYDTLQYDIKDSFVPVAKSKQAVLAYFKKYDFGIQSDIIEQIYDEYKSKTFEILAKSPDVLCNYGISDGAVFEFYDAYCRYAPKNYLRNIFISRLRDFFAAAGQLSLVTDTRLCNKLADEFGSKVTDVIKNNPYVLVFVTGKYDKYLSNCDAIALKLSADYDDFRLRFGNMRKIAFISYVLFKSDVYDNTVLCLGQSGGGSMHAYVDLSVCSAEFLKVVNLHIGVSDLVDPIDTSEFFNLLEQGSKISDLTGFSLEMCDSIRLYNYSMYVNESCVGHKIDNLLIQKRNLQFDENFILRAIIDYEVLMQIKLDDEQKQAVVHGLCDKVSVVTGGPGCGKTTVIKCMIYIWTQNCASRPLLAAPTGKAMGRMREAVGKDMIGLCETGTVARWNLTDIDNSELSLKIRNTLMIIDETSMLDINWASSFLNIYSKYVSNIVFIGDSNQLPSVGPGAFLRDICNSSSIVNTELKTCYRAMGAELISRMAAFINTNQVNNFWSNLYENPNVFRFMELHSDFAEIAAAFYDDCIARGFGDKEICVIAPDNRTVSAINLFMQAKLNPSGRILDKPYNYNNVKVGDRVVCCRNNYEAYCLNPMAKLCGGVMNGDSGYITDFECKNQWNEYAEAYVIFESDSGGIFKIEYDGNKDENPINDFYPGYAVTVHKSQGSEYKAVMVVLPHYITFFGKPAGSFAVKNLLYTAVTRAQKYICIAGSREALSHCIANNAPVRRTYLKDYLQ